MLRRLFIASGLVAVGSFIAACSGAEPGAATGTTTESAVTTRDGPKPPREAIDACANANKGAACSLSFEGHAFTGTCRNGPDGDGPLACAPPLPPPGHMPKPPQAAFDACKVLDDGAACSVGEMTGKCRRGPDGNGDLACVPPHPPPGLRMGPPKEAIDACASSSSGSACNVSLGGTDHAGSCRHGPDGKGPLACAPNDMPPPP